MVKYTNNMPPYTMAPTTIFDVTSFFEIAVFFRVENLSVINKKKSDEKRSKGQQIDMYI